MDPVPATPPRAQRKRPHDENSGETPAPKAQKTTHELESEADDQSSPSIKVTKRKKKAPPPAIPATKRPSAKTKARPPTPQTSNQTPNDIFTAPQGTPFTLNFGTPAPESLTPPQPTETHITETDNDPEKTATEKDIFEEFSTFQDEWEADPSVVATDMSKAYGSAPEDPMNCAAPGVKKEWSMIMVSDYRQGLDHYSENPFDFLTAAKFDKLTQFWRGNAAANKALSRIERDCLGETKMKKMLARVVHSAALMKGPRDEWIRSAIASITAQRTTKEQKVTKARFTIDPAKKGYSWVIIPVGAVVFNALEDVRAAMDPRSGTLVLFRPWKNESCPTQHFFATGIHREDDDVSFEIAAADYMEQIKEATAKNKVKILEMTPAPFGDTNEYTTRIKFGFEEGAIPFLINPQKLARRFWTGIGNIKRMRTITYKWPSKCYTCESESHLTSQCPWPETVMDNRRLNAYNCCSHKPGWIEPPKRPKGTQLENDLEVSIMGKKRERKAPDTEKKDVPMDETPT